MNMLLSTRVRASCACLAIASHLVWAAPARADGSAPAAQAAPAARADAAAPDAQKIDEARKYYERGLELYGESNFEAALVEMERAYQIAPSYRIQYNLGQIHRQLNNYVAAIRAYETYLKEGGTQIPAERRAEIEKSLSTLRMRVATLEVQVSVPDADISIDDVPIGRSPLGAAVAVDPGRRKVTAAKAGFAPSSQVVTVAGTDALVVRLTLVDLTRRDRVVDYAPRNRAIVAWGVTGVFTATAAVFGVLALNANDKLKTERAQFSADSAALASTLSKQSTTTKTFSILCDSFGAAAIIGAGFATYFTVKAFKSDSEGGRVNASIGPGYAGLDGRF